MSSRALRAGALTVLAPAYLPEGPRVKEEGREEEEGGEATPGVLPALRWTRDPAPPAALSAEEGTPSDLPLAPVAATEALPSGEVGLLPGRGILQ